MKIHINIIGPHHHKITLPNNFFSHQNRMAVAFRLRLFGKGKLHSLGNNFLNHLQQIELVFFFQMILKPRIRGKMLLKQMLAGLVAVNKNNFLNADFRTTINGILNNGFAVEGQKPFVQCFG